ASPASRRRRPSSTCGSDPATDSTVTVRAGSGIANAYVGSVDPSLMSNFTSSPTVSPATLVNVAGLVRVTGSAQVAVQGNTSDLTFTAAQIGDLLTPGRDEGGRARLDRYVLCV